MYKFNKELIENINSIDNNSTILHVFVNIEPVNPTYDSFDFLVQNLNEIIGKLFIKRIERDIKIFSKNNVQITLKFDKFDINNSQIYFSTIDLYDNKNNLDDKIREICKIMNIELKDNISTNNQNELYGFYNVKSAEIKYILYKQIK